MTRRLAGGHLTCPSAWGRSRPSHLSRMWPCPPWLLGSCFEWEPFKAPKVEHTPLLAFPEATCVERGRHCPSSKDSLGPSELPAPAGTQHKPLGARHSCRSTRLASAHANMKIALLCGCSACKEAREPRLLDSWFTVKEDRLGARSPGEACFSNPVPPCVV